MRLIIALPLAAAIALAGCGKKADDTPKTVEQAAASPDDVPEALEAPEGEFKPILTSAPLSPEFRDAP